MRIYLASRYGRRIEMLRYAEALRATGHTITARWVFGAHDGAFPDDDLHLPEHRTVASGFAMEDVADVQEAEILLAFTERRVAFASRGGRHVELGMALAWKREVWIVGPRENVFCCLPQVRQFSDFAAVLEALAPTYQAPGA